MNTLDESILYENLSKWQDLKNAISTLSSQSSFPAQIEGLCGSAPSFFLGRFISQTIAQKIHAEQYSSGERASQSLDFLVVVGDESQSLEVGEDLSSAVPNAEIYKFPWWGTLPYRAFPKVGAVRAERAAFLSKLLHREPSPLNKTPRIFLTSLRSFLSPLPKKDGLKGLSLSLKKGLQIDTDDLSARLAALGYLRVPRISVAGEFAVRGEVVDIFPPASENPVRILMDFDTIDKIKSFSVESQSTLEGIEKILIPPMKEVLFDEATIELLKKRLEEFKAKSLSSGGGEEICAGGLSECDASNGGGRKSATTDNAGQFDAGDGFLGFSEKGEEVLSRRIEEIEMTGGAEGEELLYPLLCDGNSILDYIAENSTVIYYDYDRQRNAIEALRREVEAMYRRMRLEDAVLPPSMTLLDFERMQKKHARSIFFRSLKTGGFSDEAEFSDYDTERASGEFFSSTISLATENSRSFFGNINYLKEQLAALSAELYSIFVFADNENQADRISQILSDLIEEANKSRRAITIIPRAISSGFSIPSEKILVIQENEIFGRRKRAPKSLKSAKSRPIDTFVDLNPGDFVVHANYGIGLFKGIERVKSASQERDYIKLEYADSDIAFVPIEQANLVQRYIGNEGAPPRLDRIGSKAWENRKNKVKQAVEELAQKLIDLYSRRKTSKGFAFPKDSQWQTEFEAAFPYEDTPDQITVTEEVKKDMERDIPMDRLICGDVGYGKTEIAMRAAFKAVLGGKQVAFMAPTTILAEQHYETCLERFKNFPVSIKQMSRFVPVGEQKKILKSLKEGGVDILIGTHRIIQNDVQFKNLGLMIIDEEQRFGVKDKEKFKMIKNNVDCLALSATPIPRTLHMSFLKIRDMSLLTTPPQNRQAIQTVIDPYNPERVASAIRAEVQRGGQVFYLHNRVETLAQTRIELEKLVPEMLIDVAHGQMTSDELDDIFRRFKLGGFHVLVSTTIIENGIDIPNVNTIIIDRADMYGVSQLYQLRGRVGRSDRQAYAYLFYPEHKVLSEIAMKRLQVISDFTQLGSGFKIAMKDMEIRGAGNLLGRDQSGHVYSVGFDMYLRLLNEAVERLTAQKEYIAQSEVLLELEYTGFIPDTYVQNPQTKMEIYKKIAAIISNEELERVYNELLDRFGPPPEEVTSLLTISEIRIIADSLHITSIKEKAGTTKIEFGKVVNINIDKLMTLIKENPTTIRLDSAHPNMIIMQTGKIGLKEKSAFISEKLEFLI